MNFVFKFLKRFQKEDFLSNISNNKSVGPGVLLKCGLSLGPLSKFGLGGDNFWGEENIFLQVKEG